MVFYFLCYTIRMILQPSTIIPLLGIESGQTILDIGSSIGYWAKPIARVVGSDGKVIAVDVHPEIIDRLNHDAAELGIENMHGVVGDIHDLANLPIKKGTMDRVLVVRMAGVMDDEIENRIPELIEFIKPEGKLIVIDHGGHHSTLANIFIANPSLSVAEIPQIKEKTNGDFMGYFVMRV